MHTVVPRADGTAWIRKPNGNPLPWPLNVYPAGSFSTRRSDFRTIEFFTVEDATAFAWSL